MQMCSLAFQNYTKSSEKKVLWQPQLKASLDSRLNLIELITKGKFAVVKKFRHSDDDFNDLTRLVFFFLIFKKRFTWILTVKGSWWE